MKPGIYSENEILFCDLFLHLIDKLTILVQEYNAWIKENLDRIGITDDTIRSYFALDVQL